MSAQWIETRMLFREGSEVDQAEKLGIDAPEPRWCEITLDLSLVGAFFRHDDFEGVPTTGIETRDEFWRIEMGYEEFQALHEAWRNR